MSSKTDQLRSRARAVVDAAKSIAEKATAENRGLTDLEKSDYEQNISQGRALLEQLKNAKADDEVLEKAESMLGSGSKVSGRRHGAKAWAVKAAERYAKTAETYGVKSLTSGTVDVPTVLNTDGTLPEHPTNIVDLVPAEPLAGNVYAYLQQIIRDNKAAPVADSALKPTSIFTFEEKEDRARVIAHLSEPFPERYLGDYGGLITLLETEMFRGVRETLDAQLLNGDGVGENFTGILNTSGIISVPFATDMLTTLRKARTTMDNVSEEPSAWLINPTDYETIDLLKATDGHFIEALAKVFGTIPVVISTAAPVGTAVLADWQQARVLTRQEIELKADASGELFKHNQVIVRAEGRFGVAVKRPQAFATISLSATP